MSVHPVIAAPQPPPPPLAARIAASATHSARALGLVWRSAPGGVLVLAAFTIVAAALPPFVAYVGKLIIDAVMMMAGAERVLGLVRQLVGLRLGIDLNVQILEKAQRLELRQFEDPDFY